MDVSSFLTLKGKVGGDLEIRILREFHPAGLFFLSPTLNSKQDCMYGIRWEERIGSLYKSRGRWGSDMVKD